MATWEEYKKTMVAPETLWRAARENNVAHLAKLLGSGHAINETDHRGYTPLMLAAYLGNLEALDYLIERGADVDAPDAAGNSPLMGVAFKGNIEAATRLLNAGAKLDAKNLAGMTVADVARTFGRTEFIAFLESRGAGKSKGSRIWLMIKFLQAYLRSRSNRRSARPNPG